MIDKKSLFSELVAQVRKIVEIKGERNELLKQVCDLLHDRVEHYDWVGFYFVDPEKDRELILGPYTGDFTDHTNISFGEGICGQAADREETFVVQDVSKETNYLSCSPSVRSEIVAPVFHKGTVVGELDIDSHVFSPFTDEDSDFVETVCGLVSRLWS